jgi:hypothetical protein
VGRPHSAKRNQHRNNGQNVSKNFAHSGDELLVHGTRPRLKKDLPPRCLVFCSFSKTMPTLSSSSRLSIHLPA